MKIYREFCVPTLHIPSPTGNNLHYCGTSVTTKDQTWYITKLHILFGSHLFSPNVLFCLSDYHFIFGHHVPILLWPAKVSDFLCFGDLESLEEYWYFAEFSRSSLTYLLPSALPHLPFLLTPVSLPPYFLGKRQRASFCLWPVF